MVGARRMATLPMTVLAQLTLLVHLVPSVFACGWIDTVPRRDVVAADPLARDALGAAGWDLDDTLADLDLDHDCIPSVGHGDDESPGVASAACVVADVVPPSHSLARLFRPPRRTSF